MYDIRKLLKTNKPYFVSIEDKTHFVLKEYSGKVPKNAIIIHRKDINKVMAYIRRAIKRGIKNE